MSSKTLNYNETYELYNETFSFGIKEKEKENTTKPFSFGIKEKLYSSRHMFILQTDQPLRTFGEIKVKICLFQTCFLKLLTMYCIIHVRLLT